MGHRSGTASQHVHFIPRVISTQKNYVYDVLSLISGEVLGTVHIYPRWRGWVLAPAHDTVWSASCLDLVREFIKTRNAEMRKPKAKSGGLSCRKPKRHKNAIH